MKKNIKIILATCVLALGLVSNYEVEATSGALVSSSVKKCSDNNSYGYHSKNKHWHKASYSKKSKRWHAVGKNLGKTMPKVCNKKTTGVQLKKNSIKKCKDKNNYGYDSKKNWYKAEYSKKTKKWTSVGKKLGTKKPKVCR